VRVCAEPFWTDAPQGRAAEALSHQFKPVIPGQCGMEANRRWNLVTAAGAASWAGQLFAKRRMAAKAAPGTDIEGHSAHSDLGLLGQGSYLLGTEEAADGQASGQHTLHRRPETEDQLVQVDFAVKRPNCGFWLSGAGGDSNPFTTRADYEVRCSTG